MPWHILDPTQAKIATAAGFGSFVSLMVTKRMGWVHVLMLFVVGQITAYFFTVPLAQWRGWSMDSYGVIGFTIGALAMLFWGTVISVAQAVRDDPMGTLARLWRLWKEGRSYDLPAPRDPQDGGVP